MPDHDDAPPDLIARFDQNLAEQRDFASLIRHYYTALIAEGFGPDDAIFLTGGYQASVLALANR
jgi:hypothetical protein